MVMPNFLVIGAMKAGTTALSFYLEQHPQVYMSPIKEPNFFAFEGEDLYSRWPNDQKGVNKLSVTDLETYRALFSEASDERAIGEASHWYLYSPKAPERIRHYVPQAKLIAVLRNPVDRAYSHFLHSVRTRTERVNDFARALREEETGNREEWNFEHYVDRGFYYTQLKRYFDIFDRNQIKIYLHEDLNHDTAGVLQDTFSFLGVNKTFLPDVSARRNVSGLPKNKFLDDFLRRPNALKRVLKRHLAPGVWLRLSNSVEKFRNSNLAKPPPLDQEVRQQLIEVYREDILKLQTLLGRDLSAWLQ